MKQVIWALAVAAIVMAHQAYAKDIAVSENNAGGVIVLTDSQSPECKKYSAANYYATNADASLGVIGCYLVKGSDIILKGLYFVNREGGKRNIEQYSTVSARHFEMIGE